MQFKDGLELSVTSGNIRQEILAENARHFLNFEYDEDMNQDAFLHLLAAGRYQLTSACSFRLKIIPCYSLFCFYEGIVDITCGEDTFTGQPGQLLFLSPSSELHYRIRSGRCHFFEICFVGSAAEHYRSLLPSVIPYNNMLAASCIPQTIDHLLEHVPHDPQLDLLMYSKWINDIFTELCVYSMNDMRLNEKIPSYILEMKKMFDSEYQNSYSLAGLEQYFEKSRYRLCREFSQYFGTSPIQYLNHRRIEEAKTLLLSTSMSVHEVGSAVGIDNTNHFIGLFKRETGTTPLVFKQEAPVAISELHYPFSPGAHPQ